jgi:hypothetical protein
MLLLAAACRPDAAPAQPPDRVLVAGRIDSVIPRGIALERFRRDIPPASRLRGGRSSQGGLVDAFWAAVTSRDTARLRELTLDLSEFAYLYYPTHPQSHPPYDLAPALMWFTLEGRGRRGVTQLLRRIPTDVKLAGHRCPPEATVQGENRVWAPCTVSWKDSAGATTTERLFGPIVERGGVYKFANYENRLD